MKPARGFTLIEVLVALVIVAVGMSALMGALTGSARNVVYLQDKTFAEWVALNQIAAIRVTLQVGQVPSVGITTGDIDLANRSWHWRQEVVGSEVPGINRIDVKVRPQEFKGGDDDGWYVTLSGLAGNSMAAPGTSQIVWDSDQSSAVNNGTSTTGTSLGNGTTNGNTGSTTSTTNSGTTNTGTGTTNPTPSNPQ